MSWKRSISEILKDENEIPCLMKSVLSKGNIKCRDIKTSKYFRIHSLLGPSVSLISLTLRQVPTLHEDLLKRGVFEKLW